MILSQHTTRYCGLYDSLFPWSAPASCAQPRRAFLQGRSDNPLAAAADAILLASWGESANSSRTGWRLRNDVLIFGSHSRCSMCRIFDSTRSFIPSGWLLTTLTPPTTKLDGNLEKVMWNNIWKWIEIGVGTVLEIECVSFGWPTSWKAVLLLSLNPLLQSSCLFNLLHSRKAFVDFPDRQDDLTEDACLQLPSQEAGCSVSCRWFKKDNLKTHLKIKITCKH